MLKANFRRQNLDATLMLSCQGKAFKRDHLLCCKNRLVDGDITSMQVRPRGGVIHFAAFLECFCKQQGYLPHISRWQRKVVPWCHVSPAKVRWSAQSLGLQIWQSRLLSPAKQQWSQQSSVKSQSLKMCELCRHFPVLLKGSLRAYWRLAMNPIDLVTGHLDCFEPLSACCNLSSMLRACIKLNSIYLVWMMCIQVVGRSRQLWIRSEVVFAKPRL